MIQWSGIKKALNSTLGTASFKSLDALVGYWADTANAAGSLHAKVVELRAKVVADIASAVSTINANVDTRKKPRGIPSAMPASYTSASNTGWNTAFDVSGKGTIYGISHYGSTGGSLELKVTIDGYVVFDGATSTSALSLLHGFSILAGDSYTIDEDGFSPFVIEFKTSFKIETYSSQNTAKTVKVVYTLE